MLTVGLTLAVLVLASTAYAVSVTMYGAPYAWTSCSRHAKQPSSSNHDDVTHAKRDISSRPASPTFSTTTNSNGVVSTFVYTTRPIVGPQGATIGTLTGYVPLTTTAVSSSAQSSSEAPASPTSTTNVATSTTTTLTSLEPSETATPSSSASPVSTVDGDFAIEVDLHLLRRRGLDFVAALEQHEQAAVPSPAAEFSFSTDQHGETVTFVKTTRAIVNPAGATIGSLNGAYVSYTPEPTPTAMPRDELRRRQL
ncbi:hypothetical protein ACM66B_007031 [Microbotryomycetes sp. NB124-2]